MNKRNSTLEQVQQQSTLALDTVNRIGVADQYMLITNARIDTHTNELLCVFMDRNEKSFIQRKYSNEALLAKYDSVNQSVVTDQCHSTLVDIMARGNMFIYRNTNEPFVIFNNGPDDVLTVPFQAMIKHTLGEYGPEPVLQVTQRGFMGSSYPYTANHVAEHLHTVAAAATAIPAKFYPQYERIVKVTPFKNKVRINFKIKCGAEVRELENNDINNALWKMFGGNGSEVGGKLRRLAKHSETMAKSKLYVIYSDDIMIGGIVSFVEGKSVVNGYITEALIIKYIKRFMEADLDGNIVNIVTK